jgi:hypothetical protein
MSEGGARDRLDAGHAHCLLDSAKIPSSKRQRLSLRPQRAGAAPRPTHASCREDGGVARAAVVTAGKFCGQFDLQSGCRFNDLLGSLIDALQMTVK